ncbi:tyrosine-type recombinase/integrase [Streptomyces orinoci]|uniref:Tyrosine-type recombinase/integrase n=1 Tax=Streptomyces orinoci TaxID=67339 RepID=A0ABV3K0G1_STRON|nr:tyrosine-type recombinase/integrase [Streptomyces orinoci]
MALFTRKKLPEARHEAGVSRITIHDLRHLAATLSITGNVPFTVVSKTLRHPTLSTTANVYAHLAHEAVPFHSPAPAASSPSASHPRVLVRDHNATTTPQTTESPPSHHCESGLRPAYIQDGVRGVVPNWSQYESSSEARHQLDFPGGRRLRRAV